MKFTAEKDIILREVAHALEIISTRNAITVLANVLLNVEGSRLTLRASDLKVNYQAHIDVEGDRDGVATVPCDKLVGVLRSSPTGEIDFELDGDTGLSVRPRSKRIDFELRALPPDKFPEFPVADDDQYFDILQSDFVEMVAQTLFAVSDDETRYFMNGVYLDRVDDKLTMIATDSHRLAFCAKDVGAEFADSGVIIPPKILSLVRKFCTGEGSLRLAVMDRSVHVHVEHRRINSGLIDAQFPNVQRVIPENQEHRMVVDRASLEEAVRRVAVLVEQKSRRVQLEVSPQTLTVLSNEGDIGSAREEFPCEYDGPHTPLAVNYQYLLDPLREMDTEQVSLAFTVPNQAITLAAVPDRDYFHIIMPMQVG